MRAPVRVRAAGARGWARLLVARRAPFQRVDAAHAQRRAVLRRGGREHCVQEDQHENAQPESAAAQSGC